MTFGRARRSRRREEGAQDSAADEGGVRQEQQSVRQRERTQLPRRAVGTLLESLKGTPTESLKGADEVAEGRRRSARGARAARGAKTLPGRAVGTQTESLKGRRRSR